MSEIKDSLSSAFNNLSDETYEESLSFYRLWFDIQHTYPEIPSDQTSDDIWNNRGSVEVEPEHGELFHPTAHLILRLARDAEGDCILGPHSPSLQGRLCSRTLRNFFENNMKGVGCRDAFDAKCWAAAYNGDPRTRPYWYQSELDKIKGINYHSAVDSNLIAHWANSGCATEAAIRNHILQSLVSHPKLYDHQADTIIILFKTAGATFETYADPSVVDRCFELLKDYYNHDLKKAKLVQELLELRERGWEGLPPPPVFTTGKQEQAGTRQDDPSATPIATSLGLPSTDPEPQVTQPPVDSVVDPEVETTSVSPATQSPSISIATLSDFTTADISDVEFPVDPTAITPHNTFYLEDGNVEVLCGNTLFRIHPTILSFHSPALRQMFAQPNLASAESPNGCPRILSSDTAADFAALLKMIYLPRPPELDEVPDFTTLSSLLRITTKYEMPAVRSHLLKAVRDAYPENFEGVTATKPLGETVFSGPSPHPNEVLNLFIRQKLTSALPMAYYMAAQRGLNSLMDRSLLQSATLPPEVLQSAIGGLMAIREVELNETHHLIFGRKGTHPCSESKCLSNTLTGPAVLEANQSVFNHIVGSSQRGTKALQVPKFYIPGNTGSGNQDDLRMFPGICDNCTGRWESAHADLRAKVWTMLPSAFGLL